MLRNRLIFYKTYEIKYFTLRQENLFEAQHVNYQIIEIYLQICLETNYLQQVLHSIELFFTNMRQFERAVPDYLQKQFQLTVSKHLIHNNKISI